MSLPISTLMQREVSVIDMDDTVAQVELLFAEKKLSWAPVAEGGRSVLGVISAADLLQFHAMGGDPAAVKAWQLCTYKPISVSPDTPLDEVARLMIERQVHHVIVDGGERIVGVVSSFDFVRSYVRG
ncbi:hypothetical protein BURC_00475 [Burkholderiaceae bacterium]|nr:hypothetical protein BURC_00475 [Burkholderiaceae bacterium]